MKDQKIQLKTTFFIGSYDWDGSLVYIKRSDNKIYRCRRDDTSILNSWTDLNDFLKSEIERLKSIHNENGTEKNPGEKTTPD